MEQFELKHFLKQLKEAIKEVYQFFGDPYFQGSAAGIAYFLFLSALPMFILLSELMGLFSLSLDAIEKWLDLNLSGEGINLIKGFFDYYPSGVNNVILALISLWAASRAEYFLMRIINYTFFDGKMLGKGYVRERGRAMLIVIIAIASLAVSLVVLIYGPVLLEALFEKSEITEAIGTVWMAMRWLVALGLLYLVISVLFYTLPSLRLPYRQVIPGTLVTSVGIILVSAIYNFYMRFNVNYDILYGSLAGAVGLLIWLWAVGWVILIGIVFNRVWWAVRDENKVPIPNEVIDKRTPTGLF
ncbi:MAG: YihY/virulence factor BrkB family protein [Clostridia bacterium]|nr:YihY/virulence factor BrkB family protein [Clostridia bacterium]